MKPTLRAMAADLDTPITEAPKIYRPVLETLQHPPMSPETRAKYADFLDWVDEFMKSPVKHDLQELQEIAKSNEKMRAYNKELAIIENLSENRSVAAAQAYKARTMNIIADGKEARDRLKTLKVSEVFNVDDSLADNMQKLCSYYNAKGSGPRYKTRRAPSNNQVLQIKRIR